MSILLQNKEHYLHRKEAAMQDKVPLIQQKKEILKDLLGKASSAGHQWEAFRSGIQRKLCRIRYHSKSLLSDLKEAEDKPCQQETKASPPKQTRMEMAHALVASQQCNEDAFSRFVGEPCYCGPLEPRLWQGHESTTSNAPGAMHAPESQKEWCR